MSLAKIILSATALVASAGLAQARDQITIAGSSTVLPYAEIVAESFGENTSFKTPIVQGGGTGAGIKQFCEGNGEASLDIANASRKMKSSEIGECRRAGVKNIMEVRIGYDGIVFASDVKGPNFAFTPSNWYNALAAEVVVQGKLVPNPYTKWSQIDPALPDQEITAFVPGTKHGTREVFEQNVIIKGCKMFKADKVLKAAHGDDKGCTAFRQDGRVVEIDGDYTETLARLKSNKFGVGVFGMAFLENNRDRLKAATFQGVKPTRETIASGAYHVSRPLFMYVKLDHYATVPGLKEYVAYFVSSEVAGKGGPLESYGLVPDPKLSATQAQVAADKNM